MEILIRSETDDAVDSRILKDAIRLALLAELGSRAEDSEVSVLLTDASAMRDLNRTYRGVDRETDVLAFPMTEAGETGGMLGDVVICPVVAARQAEEQRHSVSEELKLLVVHGVLHLLGYTDEDPRARARMFRRQDEILRTGVESAG